MPANAAAEIRFATSPLLECVLSLHVLVDPRHHVVRHDWVREMRRSLPRELKQRIGAFAFLYRHQIPDFVGARNGDATPSFGSELSALAGYSPDLLLEELGRPLYDHGGRHGGGVFQNPRVRETMRRRAAAGGSGSARLVELLLADPGAFAREFSSLLQDYWDSSFGAEWERVEPILSEAVEERDGFSGLPGSGPCSAGCHPIAESTCEAASCRSTFRTSTRSRSRR